MAGSVLGEQVLRKEDPKFLTTGGVYIDDFQDPRLDGAAYVVFARSPMAHGTIQSIDISEAVGMPGVIAVHTAESLRLEPAPSGFNPGVARTLLASGKVRWVGEPLAAVIAETYEQATDAAQAVIAEIDPLPALIDLEQSLASDLHIYEAAGSNAVFDSVFMGGSTNTGPEFFDGCEVVVTERVMNQRVAPCPLEPAVRRRSGSTVASTCGSRRSTPRARRRRSQEPVASTSARYASSPPTSAEGSAPRSAATARSCSSACSLARQVGRCASGRPAANR